MTTRSLERAADVLFLAPNPGRSARPEYSPGADTSAAKRRRSARALCANDQYGPIGVVDDSPRDAAEQHVRQATLPARADDDGASVMFGAEIEDRAPDVPIGARDERAGVEAHLARERCTLFGGRSSVAALEFVDLAKDRRVGSRSCGRADQALGRVPKCGDERWAWSEQLASARDGRLRVFGPVVCDEDGRSGMRSPSSSASAF